MKIDGKIASRVSVSVWVDVVSEPLTSSKLTPEPVIPTLNSAYANVVRADRIKPITIVFILLIFNPIYSIN